MLRVLLLACAAAASSALLLTPLRAPSLAPSAEACRSAGVSMAHHVQKKCTKKHNAMRPRKSRPSDRNRTPPNYPPIPQTPNFTLLGEDQLAALRKEGILTD